MNIDEVLSELDIEELERRRGFIGCPFNKEFNGPMTIGPYLGDRGYQFCYFLCGVIFPYLRKLTCEIDRMPCPCGHYSKRFVAITFWDYVYKEEEDTNDTRL